MFWDSMILLHCRCIGLDAHLNKLFYLFLYMGNTCGLTTLDDQKKHKDGSNREDWIFKADRFNRGGNGGIGRAVARANRYLHCVQQTVLKINIFIIHGLD